MKRRDFLKVLALSALAGNLKTGISLAKEMVASREVELIYSGNFPFQEKFLRLWIPLPMETSYQRVKSLEMKGSYSKSMLTKDPLYQSPILYVEFPERTPKEIEVRMKIALLGRKRVEIKKLDPNIKSLPEEVKLFLKPTKHIRTDGIVREYAQRITKNKRTDLDKVRAIYDWVVENMYRDPQVKGCGVGDVARALETKTFGGKCTDINSMFVALCRASNIPARELFGLRVLPSELSKGISNVKEDATKAQHCRAEFWLNRWIPADPADVRKFILEEKVEDFRDPKLMEVRRFMLGGWDNHWVLFNYGRDFSLVPPTNQGETINEFMYPQAELEGKLLDKLEVTFNYSKYTVKVIT